MSVQEAFARAVEALGSQKALAASVGRSQAWVSDGVRGALRFVTVTDAFAMERATRGAVSARDFVTTERRRGDAPAAAPGTEAA